MFSLLLFLKLCLRTQVHVRTRAYMVNLIFFFLFGVQRSITYLFPSGLFEKRAHPLMKVSNWLFEYLVGQIGLLRLQYD